MGVETVEKVKEDMTFDVVDEIITDMPEISEHVIEQDNDEAEQRTEEQPPKTTDDFDPEIHAAGADGGPVFNKDGSLRKKRGRKSQLNTDRPNDQQGNNNAKLDVARQSAEQIDALYWANMSLFFPSSVNAELQKQVGPHAVNAMAEGFAEMEEPPKIHWAAVVGTIYASSTIAILRQPEVRNQYSGFFGKSKMFIAKLFKRRKKGKEDNSDRGE